MALGRPDNKFREKKDGLETEEWMYRQRGIRTLFVLFENDLVVRIRQYQ
jgi:hypothetical protein